VADLLRQRQAFWQLPTVVSVLAGGGGGGGGGRGSYVGCATVGLLRRHVVCEVKPHGGIDFGRLDPRLAE
jgi:hypothetical protein